MQNTRHIQELQQQLEAFSTCGIVGGMHIRAAVPLVHMSSLSERWMRIYAENSFYLCDPIVFWALQGTGVTRWSEITQPDPLGLFARAREHGLRYGAAVSCGPCRSRSVLSVVRDDRELSDTELLAIEALVQQLHDLCEPRMELTPAQIEALRCIGEGHRYTAAAAALGISESALKARLKSARLRLRARTTTEAIGKAREFRLI